MKLIYRNNAMNEQLKQPMLIGSSATDLGFRERGISEKGSQLSAKISHPDFNEKWQCQSISYLQNGNQHKLFSALNVANILQKNQTTTQNNLIRVLAHELRNSLTPMTSMADTLLGAEQLDEPQTRLVLSRIKNRSDRLLSFIGEYSKLAKLPPPKLVWFNFDEVFQEAKAMQHQKKSTIEFTGTEQCYGDHKQISQILINLFKNSLEACTNIECKIQVHLFQNQQGQVIEVIDNGSGFSNFENILTPFYTTKINGSCIGLTLCAEILKNHQGDFIVENIPTGGAKITMSWPAF